jgi:hypothetical protein
MMLRSEPDALLDSLQRELGVNELNEKSVISQFQCSDDPAQRARADSLFEVMVRLYYKCKPTSLVPFVDAVARSDADTQKRERCARALFVLPPPLPQGEHSSAVQARVELMRSSGDAAMALRILLKLEKWHEALALMRAHANELEQQELFYAMFDYCLQHKVRSRV